MKIDIFDYNLPSDLIAQEPSVERDGSKLLICERDKNDFKHVQFRQILDYLKKDDVLVFNNTRVIPSVLMARRSGFEGKIEIFIIKINDGNICEVLARPARKLKPGVILEFGQGEYRAEIKSKKDDMSWFIKFEPLVDIAEVMDKFGYAPLPPYIKRDRNFKKLNDWDKLDRDRYQTVYAFKKGAVAAPTAGFHFTSDLLSAIKEKGIEVVFVTLYVGYGTFKPIRVEDIREHKMHKEYYEISKESALSLNRAIKNRKKIIAVGTTVVRVLETIASRSNIFKEEKGFTDLFIYPGFDFKIVKGMITKFSPSQIIFCLF